MADYETLRVTEPLPVRPPRQDRSRASHDRMMNAAQALLVDKGNDSFTLADVGRVAKVSIGSIYNRFRNKDELIHAVHTRAMERIELEQVQIVMRARSRAQTPVDLVRALIEELGEFLAAHANLMRPYMLRGADDEAVQHRGALAHDNMVSMIVAEIIAHSGLIQQPDPERAIRAVVGIAYSAFARQLGFGMPQSRMTAANWSELKADAAAMAALFLFGSLGTIDAKSELAY